MSVFASNVLIRFQFKSISLPINKIHLECRWCLANWLFIWPKCNCKTDILNSSMWYHIKQMRSNGNREKRKYTTIWTMSYAFGSYFSVTTYERMYFVCAHRHTRAQRTHQLAKYNNWVHLIDQLLQHTRCPSILNYYLFNYVFDRAYKSHQT